jgi:competence protein ComEC
MQAVRFYQRPVIPLTVALMAGIALGGVAPGYSSWALVLALACGFGTARCRVRRQPAAISPLVLFVSLGYLSLQVWVDPRFPENHVSRLVDSGPWRIVGVVDARPLEFESRTQFVLRTARLQSGSDIQAVSGLLRVTAIGETLALQQGDRVALHGRIRSIRNFNNPGGFDFKRSMAYREIWAGATVAGTDLVLIEKGADHGLFGAIDRMRSGIAGLIDQAGLGPEAAVLKALVMGDQSGIAPETRQAFMRTGTSHILAISGLHITIVASIAFALFRWLLGWIPIALRQAWTHKGAAVLTLAPITLYAVIAGFSPSTQRSLLMVAVFLMAFLAEREPDLLNTLALAALVILCVQPAALFSISFQLSFVAVLSIVWVFERMRMRRSAAPSDFDGRVVQIRRSLLTFFGVSLAATWGTLPLGMYYFNNVPFVGLLANCIAIPLMGYLAVAAGLLGTLLAAFSTPAAVACYQIGGWVVSKSMLIMDWIAKWPYAAGRTVSPSVPEIIWFYLASWAAFHLLTGRSHTPSSSNTILNAGRACDPKSEPATSRWPVCLRFHAIRSAGRGRKAMWAVLILSLTAAGLDAGYWIYQRFWRPDLRVTMIDVGHGSAVLLEFPGGGTALVDGGGFADSATFDVGGRVVAPLLWKRKIATVDTLILTHPNSDHVNGLVFIAENFHVRSLWTNGEFRPIKGYEALMHTAAQSGIAVPRFTELPRESMVHGVQVEVLYPPVDFLDRQRAERWRQNENNNSLVIRLSLGNVSVLIPGDIMRPAEKELVARVGGGLKSTFLIAPHHGSRSSSSEEFVRAVSPKAVLISCAGRVGSGIPHPQILHRYESCRAGVYRTDRHGAVHITTDGYEFKITPFLKSN